MRKFFYGDSVFHSLHFFPQSPQKKALRCGVTGGFGGTFSNWVEQNPEEEKGSEKSLREIGRIIASEVEKHFEVEVKPETIRKRASRQCGTNVPPEENNDNSSTNSKLEKLEKLEKTQHGGAREGAGRKLGEVFFIKDLSIHFLSAAIIFHTRFLGMMFGSNENSPWVSGGI